jgi:hypothetical protein
VTLLVVLDRLIIVARGDAIGIASTVRIGLETLTAFAFGVGHHVRRHRRLREHTISRARLHGDRQMAGLCAIGYGTPLRGAVAMVLGVRIDGLPRDAQASTVACLPPLGRGDLQRCRLVPDPALSVRCAQTSLVVEPEEGS